jgi:RNA polymerase sigma-70 factor (ECF subfamily)
MPPPDTARARWFEVHVKPHEPMLRAWLRRRFPAMLDVDDIVQESYLRLLRLRPEAALRSPKAFLFAIARNLALDQLRRRTASGEVALEADPAAQPADENAATSEAERCREIELLREAIEALPGRCREIFRLRKVEGLSQAQIAERLQISEHTVSAQLTIGFHKCADYVIARAAWRRREP